MAVQEPLYWINEIPIYPTSNSVVIQNIDNTPDIIDALGELKINSLVFDEPSEITIVSGTNPYIVSTSGTSYISLTSDAAVVDINDFEITFDIAEPAAKLLLVLFSSAPTGGGLKITANQALVPGPGTILLKDDEDIIVDPTDVNAYNRASILFLSDGSNWIELNRFLYTV